MGTGRTNRAIAGRAALALAVGAHLVLIAVWKAQTPKAKPSSPPIEVAGVAAPAATASVAVVDLTGLDLMELPVGAADELRPLTDEVAGGAIDAPGARQGSSNDGPPGQRAISSRDDDAHRSATLWNDPRQQQMQEVSARANRKRSPEALERMPRPGSSSGQRAEVRGQLGSSEGQEGVEDSDGSGGAAGVHGSEWASLDPRFDMAPARVESHREGSVRSPASAPLVNRGERASDQPERGRAGTPTPTPPRSSSPSPSPMAFSASSRGGQNGLGAGGSGRSHGQVGPGRGASGGEGSGDALPSTRARRDDPYFFRMYGRIDKALEFPRSLALKLEQGEVTLRIELSRAGKILDLRVRKGSGFAAFDREALRAFRAAAPFGAPPRSLIGDRDRLVVIAPYFFRNPLIR